MFFLLYYCVIKDLTLLIFTENVKYIWINNILFDIYMFENEKSSLFATLQHERTELLMYLVHLA